MASYTTNLNLKKPAGSENVAIGDINNNMDTIDQAFGTLNSKSTSTLATGITLFKCGNMRIINCTNGSGSITTDGLPLGETAVAVPANALCLYYDGNSNQNGLLRVEATKLYLKNTSGTNVSGSYVQGQIIYYV